MLLAANIGNSIISFGFFEDGCKMAASFCISTNTERTSDEYFSIIDDIARRKGINRENADGAVISSVVPRITEKIVDTVKDFWGVDPLLVGPGVKTGFRIKIDDPSELGGDMVANTAAALKMKKDGQAAVIADLGDVNTISAVSKDGEYLGCAILPGIQLCLNTLHGETAQLPNVNVGSLSKAIGKNSQNSVRAGVILGSALAIDGLAEKFAFEMRTPLKDVKLIATGVNALDITTECKNKFDFEKDLTLKGLYYIYKHNL